jgi:hypothetical protein
MVGNPEVSFGGTIPLGRVVTYWCKQIDRTVLVKATSARCPGWLPLMVDNGTVSDSPTSTDGRPLCKSLSREKKTLLRRATEERAKTNTFRTHSSQRMPLGGWFLPLQNQTSICCLGPVGPSQKIEFVFSASPETIRREPRELDFLRSVGQLWDLAVCAPCNPVIFFLPQRRFRPPP